MHILYIIECRDASGKLDFTAPQPEEFFGIHAITGIDTNQMAQRIFSKVPDAKLTGDSVPAWPRLIDPRWSARKKTW